MSNQNAQPSLPQIILVGFVITTYAMLCVLSVSLYLIWSVVSVLGVIALSVSCRVYEKFVGAFSSLRARCAKSLRGRDSAA